MRRKESFKAGLIYHIFNKSIANYKIFSSPDLRRRFIENLDYYNIEHLKYRYSVAKEKGVYRYENILIPKPEITVKFISYNIMLDHYHLVIKILKNKLFSDYLGNAENSYCRHFNLKFHRKGPLFQSRFKAVLIRTNEQLLHVTRYVHLNPTTSELVERPEDWPDSSYLNIITDEKFLKKFLTEISIRTSSSYKKFVENNLDYQKNLKRIKKLLLE